MTVFTGYARTGRHSGNKNSHFEIKTDTCGLGLNCIHTVIPLFLPAFLICYLSCTINGTPKFTGNLYQLEKKFKILITILFLRSRLRYKFAFTHTEDPNRVSDPDSGTDRKPIDRDHNPPPNGIKFIAIAIDCLQDLVSCLLRSQS